MKILLPWMLAVGIGGIAAISLARPAIRDVSRTAPVVRPEGDVAFQAVLDLPQSGQSYNAQLRGGQDAIPTDWPASFYFKYPTPTGPEGCTAALIGPQVVLTAAHCIPVTGKVSFTFGNQPPYEATCSEDPVFETDASADFALCALSRRFAAPDGFKYETVRDASMENAVGSGHFVMLTGFGCTTDLVADTNKIDGKYRVGFTLLDESSTSRAQARGADYYTPAQNNNLFSVYDPSTIQANLCPGDSGGPAFVLKGGNGSVVQFRDIIGVNSRVFYDDTGTRYRDSLIAATGGPDFRPWAKTWLGAKLSACGFTPAPKGAVCR